MPELLARMDKVLKRSGKADTLFQIGDIEIDTEKRAVSKADLALALTPIEFDLLLLLVKNRNLALSREKILATVWDIRYEGGTRTVDVHIAQVRKKTGLRIVSLPKIGYRLEV